MMSSTAALYSAPVAIKSGIMAGGGISRSGGGAPCAILKCRGLAHLGDTEADLRAFFGAFKVMDIFVCRRQAGDRGALCFFWSKKRGVDGGCDWRDPHTQSRRFYACARTSMRFDQHNLAFQPLLASRGRQAWALASQVLQGSEGSVQQLSHQHNKKHTTKQQKQQKENRCTGEAFVVLDSPAAAAAALAALDRQYLGARYVELFPATAADLAHTKALLDPAVAGYVVRLRGLPYSATREFLFVCVCFWCFFLLQQQQPPLPTHLTNTTHTTRTQPKNRRARRRVLRRRRRGARRRPRHRW